MTSHRFATAKQTFLVGPDLLSRALPTALETESSSRVAVFLSPSVAKSATGRRVLEALSDFEVVAVIDDIRHHSPIVDTERAAEKLRKLDVHAVIAVGGGSVSDTAKAVSILLGEGGRLEDLCSVFTPPDKLVAPVLPNRKAPLIAVPTTFSAAEVTPGGGATNAAGLKRVFWDPQISVRHALFDTDVLAEVPTEVLTTTGMNALAHCVEGLYSKMANPFSTGLAREGSRLLTLGLAAIARDGETASAGALAAAASGAALSGLVITNARVGLHHAICHVLGAKGGLSHGVANSIMLPYVLRYNADHTEEGQALFLAAVREGAQAADVGTSSFDGLQPWEGAAILQRLLKVPSTLQEVGISREDLPSFAQDVMQDRGLFFNPKPVPSPDVVLEVLEAAWGG